MQHLFFVFAILCLAPSLAAQNPNCRPVIVAYNGLATTLLPINTDADPETDLIGVRVKATDFIRYCSSPCGAKGFQYRIRKVGEGVGFPADSTVLFTCEEQFTQEVEIWASDPQGNMAFVLVYIVIQDNLEKCNGQVQPILPNCSSDAMRPTLLALHGLSANIVPSATGGTARVAASDLVLSRNDNCPGPIPLRIRKSGQGTGVPTTASVSFNCNELGVQEVEIWTGDLQKNWTYVNTYVFVQDNGLNSSDCKVATPGCSPDKIPMAIELLNGLAVNIAASGRVKLRATDWLRKRTDNCSVPVALRISKTWDETSAPPMGTEVEFTCAELGQQEVKVWSRDLAGNWSYAVSYVIVQDSYGSCGQMKSNRSDETASSFKETGELRLFPNPAVDAFALKSSGEPFSRIDMIDMMGRKVRNIELDQPVHQHTLQVSDLPAGIYQVRAGGQVIQMVVAH